MTKGKNLNISNIIKEQINKNMQNASLIGDHCAYNQIFKKGPITNRLLMRYTEPFIYYGISNRGNHFKPRKDISKDWYIGFRFFNEVTGKMVPFCKKGGINRYHTIKEREFYAEALRDAWSELLKQGMDPLAEMVEPTDGELLQLIPFSRALQFAYDKRESTIVPATASNWRGVIRGIVPMIKEDKPISRIKRADIKLILDSMNLEANPYNRYREALSSLFDEMIQYEMIDVNPVKSIKRKKRPKATRHAPPNEDIRQKVVDELRKTFPEFYLFCKIVFRTGIRPDEILDIKAEHIDNLFIRLVPKEESSKKKARFVPIDSELYEELKAIPAKPGEYLFSLGFKPGPKRINQLAPAKAWREYVKKPLGITNTLYSLKHAGGNARVQAGNNLDDVKEMFGHTTVEMTKVYVTEYLDPVAKRIREVKPKF